MSKQVEENIAPSEVNDTSMHVLDTPVAESVVHPVRNLTKAFSSEKNA